MMASILILTRPVILPLPVRPQAPCFACPALSHRIT